MSLFSFVEKLLPRIERNTIEEDLRVTEKELSNVVLPSLQAAGVHFKINRPGSRVLKNMELIYYRHCKFRGSKPITFLHDIIVRTEFLQKNLTFLSNNIDKYIDKDVLSQGLTAQSAFVIRSVSHMSILTRYLSSLLNFVYVAESEHLDNDLIPELDLSKAERNYIDHNFENFCKLMSKYGVAEGNWKDMIAKMPAIYVSPSNKDAAADFYRGMEMDPLEQVGLSGFVGSAIYSARMVFARWQQDRYDAAQAKKQQLQLRLLYLQMQANDEKDPTLENEIRILQDRIESLEDRIRREEEKYGIFK